MEESDEPEQPVSLGRQEFRRRRRPSQPMVDKSQQTDVTEKKKPVAVVQSPACKTTLNIDRISGSKGNYSAKEYESRTLSSQLQQTWVKRKCGMKMTDRSLQTDVPVEEKAIFIDKTLTFEEQPASVGETAPGLPESVPEVEITNRPTTRLIDRSQQTSCTGDWSLLSICSKDKVDKEQQTYLSELEITIMSMPSSSPIKSKEETVPVAQEGSSFEVNGCLEIEVLSTEKIPDAMMPFTEGEFSGEIQALPADELPSEEAPVDIGHLPGQGDLSDESYDQQNPQGAEVSPSELPTEIRVAVSEEVPVKDQNLAMEVVLQSSGKVEPATAEESTDGVQPPPSEEPSKEIPVEVQLPLDKQAIEAVTAEIALVLDEEYPIEEVFEGGQPPSTEEAPSKEALAEVSPLPAEEAPAMDIPAGGQPPSTEEAPSKEALAEVSPPPAEEAPAMDIPAIVMHSPTEKASKENSSEEILPPTAEEAPGEETSAEVPPPPADEAPTEKTSTEVQSPSLERASLEGLPLEEEEEEVIQQAQENPLEDSPIEMQPLPAEEDVAEGVPVEFQALPAEEYLAGEATAEVQQTSFEGTPIEETPAEVQLPAAEVVPEEEAPEVQSLSLTPADEVLAEVQFPQTEETPLEEAPEVQSLSLTPADEVLAEVQFPQTEETPLEGAPVEVQSLPVEEVLTEVVPVEEGPAAEIGFPSSEGAPIEETTMEAQLTSVKESPEEASDEFQIPPPETPAEESPVLKQPSQTDVVPTQELLTQETPAEAPLPPSEQTSEDKALLKEDQLSPVAGVSEKELESSSLAGDRNAEGADPIPADVSRSKDEPMPTFKIEGTLKIELKNPPS